MSERAFTSKEQRALSDAAGQFDMRGIDFRCPWQCDLDDIERERFHAMVAACQAYHFAMSKSE